MKRVLAIILGGGAGTRLYPLTKMRAKPAVPLAGKYRLIDIPISNCINSGINKMYVLTQFNSASLNRHLTQSYNLSAGFGQGFVEVLAAQQTPESPSWFEGTADAPLAHAGPWIAQRFGGYSPNFVLDEAVCPGCGTLLDVEERLPADLP